MYILTTKQQRFDILQAACNCEAFRAALWPNCTGVTGGSSNGCVESGCNGFGVTPDHSYSYVKVRNNWSCAFNSNSKAIKLRNNSETMY